MDAQRIILFVVFSVSLRVLWNAWPEVRRRQTATRTDHARLTPVKTAHVRAFRIGCDHDEGAVPVLLRLGRETVEKVAAVTVMFAAHGSNALTGQSLLVSHGWFMQ